MSINRIEAEATELKKIEFDLEMFFEEWGEGCKNKDAFLLGVCKSMLASCRVNLQEANELIELNNQINYN